MAAIRGRDTKPELIVRRGLHRRGFRFRLGGMDLPGRPDLVLARRGASIFVHGCFWHGHDCPLFRLPQTRREFWDSKIASNRRRDAEALELLKAGGWRTAVVWECALRGRQRLSEEEVFTSMAEWLRGTAGTLEIAGKGASVAQ